MSLSVSCEFLSTSRSQELRKFYVCVLCDLTEPVNREESLMRLCRSQTDVSELSLSLLSINFRQ